MVRTSFFCGDALDGRQLIVHATRRRGGKRGWDVGGWQGGRGQKSEAAFVNGKLNSSRPTFSKRGRFWAEGICQVSERVGHLSYRPIDYTDFYLVVWIRHKSTFKRYFELNCR